MKSQFTLSAYAAQRVDKENRMLYGVIVCEVGPAKGHGFGIDMAFCNNVVRLAASAGTIKVRANHPDKDSTGDVLSIVGEASNFRMDGNVVRADVKLFQVDGDNTCNKLLSLAENASEHFGMSLDFNGKKIKNGNNLATCSISEITALDFVDTPAAARMLFSAGSEPVVDFSTNNEGTNNTEINMTADELKKALSEGMFEATKQLSADIAGIKTSQETFCARLAALEAKKDDKKEDKKDGKEEDKLTPEEEKMAKLAAQVTTITLAQCGIKPRRVSDVSGDGSGETGKKDDEHQLSTSDAAIADELGFDDAQRKQFAINLAACGVGRIALAGKEK